MILIRTLLKLKEVRKMNSKKVKTKAMSLTICVMMLMVICGISGAGSDVIDDNLDGMPDGLVIEKPLVNGKGVNKIASISIGMVQTADWSTPKTRLEGLGYTVTLIPPSSGMGTFVNYDVVYLPVGWAQGGGDYPIIEANAADYNQFVLNGGGLFVDQPNPYMQPGDQVTPTLLPHPITFYNWYNTSDWPPVVVDPFHYITQGLPPEDMPGPADQMTSVDPAYDILVEGAATHSPSLVVTDFGGGKSFGSNCSSELFVSLPFQ